MITPISWRFKHNPCRRLLLEAVGSLSIHARVVHTWQTRSSGLQQSSFATLRQAQLPWWWAQLPSWWAQSPG